MKKFLCTVLAASFLFTSVSFADNIPYQHTVLYINGKIIDTPEDYGTIDPNYPSGANYNSGQSYNSYPDEELFPFIFDDIYKNYTPEIQKPQEVKMPTYKTEKERLKNLAHDSAYYYEAKYRKPVNQTLAEKVENKIDKIKDEKTAKASMTTIKIPVWQIGSGGKKYTTFLNLTVLKEIAPDVKAIFTEIYKGKEKFPIHSIGGYAWRDGSGFHPLGLAIDINPTYNPQFKEDGVTPIVGSYYNPKKYPQSIGPDSDVVKAFGKRGWTWGAKFSKPDIMHFSYLEW